MLSRFTRFAPATLPLSHKRTMSSLYPVIQVRTVRRLSLLVPLADPLRCVGASSSLPQPYKTEFLQVDKTHNISIKQYGNAEVSTLSSAVWRPFSPADPHLVVPLPFLTASIRVSACRARRCSSSLEDLEAV